uniref:hypothetical protein n=1 Tax=Candidatus Limisoma sp. TaxID=3076476 RepID=UPI004024E172
SIYARVRIMRVREGILPKQNGILKALIIKQVKFLLRQNVVCLGKNYKSLKISVLVILPKQIA